MLPELGCLLEVVSLPNWVTSSVSRSSTQSYKYSPQVQSVTHIGCNLGNNKGRFDGSLSGASNTFFNKQLVGEFD